MSELSEEAWPDGLKSHYNEFDPPSEVTCALLGHQLNIFAIIIYTISGSRNVDHAAINHNHYHDSNDITLLLILVLCRSSSGIAMAGSTNIRNTNNPNLQRVFFNTVMIMPLWNNETFNHDIALVRVDTPFVVNLFVQVARLPRMSDMTSAFLNQRTTVAGWGSIAPWVSQTQRFLRNQVMGRFSCTLAYPTLSGPMNICTSGSVNSPCQGDSGAPIHVQESDAAETVIGLLSFGSALGCGSTRPAMYTLVGPYLQWVFMVTQAVIRD